MLTTNFMWHPAGEARQYEAAGSRIAFHERWSDDEKHPGQPVQREDLLDALQTMIDVLTDDQKTKWLGEIDLPKPNGFSGH